MSATGPRPRRRYGSGSGDSPNWFDLLSAVLWALLGIGLVWLATDTRSNAWYLPGLFFIAGAVVSGILTRGWRDYAARRPIWRWVLANLPGWSFLFFLVLFMSIGTCSLPS